MYTRKDKQTLMTQISKSVLLSISIYHKSGYYNSSPFTKRLRCAFITDVVWAHTWIYLYGFGFDTIRNIYWSLIANGIPTPLTQPINSVLCDIPFFEGSKNCNHQLIFPRILVLFTRYYDLLSNKSSIFWLL